MMPMDKTGHLGPRGKTGHMGRKMARPSLKAFIRSPKKILKFANSRQRKR